MSAYTDDVFRKHNYKIHTAINLIKTGIALEKAVQDGVLSECEKVTFERMVGSVVTAITNAIAVRCQHNQSKPIR